MTLAVPASQQAPADSPIPAGYVLHLQTKLLEAEAALIAMNEKYEQVKARFDRSYARQGITPQTDMVTYVNVKYQNPELRYWYSKVEHFQRELAAYGSALTGLEAGHRMLATASRPAAAASHPAAETNGRAQASNGRAQTSRRRVLSRAR